MNDNFNPALLSAINRFARECDIDRVILFGSRARGDNLPRSDIDLAVVGDADLFRYRLDEHAPTLLKFDVVDLSRDLPSDFRASILKDGVVIYEKT